MRALALLDRPGQGSFGMTPVVVADDKGQVTVLGLAPSSVHRGRGLVEAQVQELLRGGHALAIDSLALEDNLPPNTVALWLGDKFAERAASLHLPPAPLPASSTHALGGQFFLGPAGSMYPYLERWSVAALRRLLAESNPSIQREIAKLMQWVLPNRPESLAAAWSTSPHPERELQMQLRTFVRDRTEEELRAAHKACLESPSDELADLRLLAFTGGTGIAREKVANRFAEQFALEVATFARPIKERVSANLEHITDRQKKLLLMDRGQAEVDISPLGLAIATLRSAKPRQNILVLDSLRHSAIRETIKWLQPKKFYVVAVTVDEDLRRGRVKDRGFDPEELFQHRTEREIPDLTRDASRRVGETVPDRELQEIFESLQA